MSISQFQFSLENYPFLNRFLIYSLTSTLTIRDVYKIPMILKQTVSPLPVIMKIVWSGKCYNFIVLNNWLRTKWYLRRIYRTDSYVVSNKGKSEYLERSLLLIRQDMCGRSVKTYSQCVVTLSTIIYLFFILIVRWK